MKTLPGILLLSIGVLLSANTLSETAAGDLTLPAKDDWRYLSFEQRHAQMTFLIHPAMMERFQSFYKTTAPELTCETCHGKGAEAVGYDLSNSKLDGLDPKKVAALYRSDAVLTAEQIFKRDNITPTMARLLGVANYDPQTGLGFSCFGCHRREESP